jgi:hypothetical protein
MGLAQTHALEERRKNILRDWDPGTSLVSAASLEKLKELDRRRGVTKDYKPSTDSGYGPDNNPMNLRPGAGGNKKMMTVVAPDGEEEDVFDTVENRAKALKKGARVK